MALGYVRPARAEDAEEIARIQLTTWRSAYRSVVPDEVLDGLEEEWLREQWHDACTNPPTAAHQVLVAIEQQESDRQQRTTVGFAAVGPDEDDGPTQAGLVTELLVEPRFGRRGHGSRLLSAAAAHWQEHQLPLAHAWVFPRDSASMGFYKSAGWDADGVRRTLDMNGVPVPQLRLHVDVSPESGQA